MTSPVTPFKLNARVRLSVELALTASSGDAVLMPQQDENGRALGLTGAEIDLARRGSSFDVKIARAIAFALTVCEETRIRARRAGLCERSCTEIERIAQEHSRSRA
jgi:hypothetical protein